MDNENEVTTLDDDGIVDASDFNQAERAPSNDLEKEEREEAKKEAVKAKKGAYVATRNLKCDGKSFKRGDDFEGKIYADLTEGRHPAIVTKKAWQDR